MLYLTKRAASKTDGLSRCRSVYRTCISTCAAVDAGVGIDYENAVSLRDRFYRALRCTCAAADACVFDNISHTNIPP